MQAQHIIILTALAVCSLLLTVFVERAIKRALCTSYRFLYRHKSWAAYLLVRVVEPKEVKL